MGAQGNGETQRMIDILEKIKAVEEKGIIYICAYDLYQNIDKYLNIFYSR